MRTRTARRARVRTRLGWFADRQGSPERLGGARPTPFTPALLSLRDVAHYARIAIRTHARAQAITRNNKVYITTIFIGAIFGERIVHSTINAMWEANNQGVRQSKPLRYRRASLPQHHAHAHATRP